MAGEPVQEHEAAPASLRDLYASGEALRILVDAVSDYAIIMLDPSGRIVTWNSGARRIKGYEASEILGEHLSRFYPPDDAADGKPQRCMNRALVEGRYEEEGWRVRKGGSMFWANLILIPLRDKAGNHIGFAKITRDLTARRAMEAQLLQAQKMEAIGNLTGGIAHDFNNLLAIIIGNLDLLTERPGGDPDATVLAEEALDAALRGADLTQRLLAFARRQPLAPERIDLNAVAVKISKLLRRIFGDNVELKLDLGGGLWPVTADPSRLEASIVNIVNNSRDAMPSGGVIRIATSNQDVGEGAALDHPGVPPGQFVMIEITDTGEGMTADVLDHVFEPFFTTKEEGKGSGLGLSMVFGFIKQSGGHVTVQSTPGAGTAMRLYLPRAEAAEARKALPKAPVEGGGHETILVVEDNPTLRNVVMRQLGDLGYCPLEAKDGRSALELLAQNPVDLLFTDIVMPGGISGYELARTAQTRWPAVKVILTSGYPDAKLNTSDRPTDIRLLSKPYRKADLARALREVLDARPG